MVDVNRLHVESSIILGHWETWIKVSGLVLLKDTAVLMVDIDACDE